MECGGGCQDNYIMETYRSDSLDYKNAAIAQLNAEKGMSYEIAQPISIDKVAADKDQMSPGQLPRYNKPKKAKKAVTWTQAGLLAVGAALLLFFVLKIKLLKIWKDWRSIGTLSAYWQSYFSYSSKGFLSKTFSIQSITDYEGIEFTLEHLSVTHVCSVFRRNRRIWSLLPLGTQNAGTQSKSLNNGWNR